MKAASDPLVTLVMPVWNPRKEWLTQAVESALGQTGCSVELIVIDDGCPEPVERLLADVADPRLRIIRVEHGGPSHARNVGVSNARGRLIRFVDADDIYEPDSTARLAALIDADDVIAYGSTVFCDEELRPVWTMSSRLEGNLAKKMALGHFPVRTPSLLFPRAVVEAAGGWDTTFPVCGDLDFIARALEHATVRRDPGVASYYRKHATSTSSDFTKGLEGGRRVVERYFERHPEQRGSALERRALAARDAVEARVYASRRMTGQALRALVRSLVTDPRAFLREALLTLPPLRGHIRQAVRSRGARFGPAR